MFFFKSFFAHILCQNRQNMYLNILNIHLFDKNHIFRLCNTVYKIDKIIFGNIIIKRAEYMDKTILFISNKKLPKKYNGLKNDFLIFSKRSIINAYKFVFLSPPDIILLNMVSIFENLYFYKLIKILPETQNIPIIFINDRYSHSAAAVLEGIKQIPFDTNAEKIKTIIDEVLKTEMYDKNQLAKIKINAKQIKEYTAGILDEIIFKTTIVEEFKSLADNMNFDDVLCANIFKILEKYIHYEAAGIFFNNSDERQRNILNLSLPNKNITIKTTDDIRDNFFDEMEKYKTVNEIQCNLIDGAAVLKSEVEFNSFKKIMIIPYKYCSALCGGIVLAFQKEPNLYERAFLKVIIKELDVIFKIKYLFNEQENHSVYDTMTGLFNKQEFSANLEKEFYRARRYIYNFTLAMLDIDNFSEVNEKHGRDFGDYVIKELSRLLKAVLRRTDVIYRFGGEEIIILLPSTPIAKAVIPTERLRSQISKHLFKYNDIEANITVSVGLCANYSRFTAPEQLFDAVNTSLKRAKKRGRNKIDIFE